jgi:hypothetical protein
MTRFEGQSQTGGIMTDAWDMVDWKTLKPEKLNPEDFSKPMVSPPSGPVPEIPQETER